MPISHYWPQLELTSSTMDSIDKDTINYLRTWLSNRQQPNDDIDHYQTSVMVQPGEKLRSHGLCDLHLRRYKGPQLQQSRVLSQPLELGQLLKWMGNFWQLMRDHREQLEALELMRHSSGSTSLRAARFRVQEAVNLVRGACCLEWALDLGPIEGPEFVLVEESSGAIHEILLQLCVCLFTLRPVRLIARASHYGTCLLAAYLLDLSLEAGARQDQVQLLVQEQRVRGDSSVVSSVFAGDWHPLSPFRWHPLKHQVAGRSRGAARLLTAAICFGDCDIQSAVANVLSSYSRHPERPNLIVLVEESVYSRFTAHWPEALEQAAVNDSSLEQLSVDLNCIDMSLAYRASGRCLNVIKFRTTEELGKLIAKLRKVPRIQLFTNRLLFARELCLGGQKLNNCNEFWLNHLPPTLSGKSFHEQLVKYYRDSLRQHMSDVYSDVLHEHEEKIEEIKKLQAAYLRLKGRVHEEARARDLIGAYANLIHKFRSLKPSGSTVAECVSRLKQFHLLCSSNSISSEASEESRVETKLRPVGVAILVAKTKNCIKSKAALLEFIFKNLLVGNGVLLLCPLSLLGLRFPLNLLLPDKLKLPFALIDLQVADQTIADLNNTQSTQTNAEQESSSWDSSSSDSKLGASVRESSRRQVKCPRGIYALEFDEQHELSSERVNSMLLALGCRRRSLWLPDALIHCGQFPVPINEQSAA